MKLFKTYKDKYAKIPLLNIYIRNYNMKEFIYSEMMVHVPLCTSKNPQNVLVVSDNAESLTAEFNS